MNTQVHNLDGHQVEVTRIDPTTYTVAIPGIGQREVLGHWLGTSPGLDVSYIYNAAIDILEAQG